MSDTVSDIRPAPLLVQLAPHSLGRQHRVAAQARCVGAIHSAVWKVLIFIWLENLK